MLVFGFTACFVKQPVTVLPSPVFLNVALSAWYIASCVHLTSYLNGDIFTVVFSCREITLSAIQVLDNFIDDLQQMTAVQLEATTTLPPFSHLNLLNWQYLSFLGAHVINHVCLCTCLPTLITLVYLSSRFALDWACLWSILY